MEFLTERAEENELVTVADLKSVMTDCGAEPYGTQYIKQKLQEKFEGQLMIADRCGKTSVITFCKTAEVILQDHLAKAAKLESPEEQKQQIIKAASELIKSDINTTNFDPGSYFSVDEITTEDQLKVVPDSLKTLLRGLIPKRTKTDRSLVVASIGQSIMHLAMNHFTPVLHLITGLIVHNRTGSQLVVDILHKQGYSCSATQVRDFLRCAAVEKMGMSHILELVNHLSGVLYAADNVDVNKVTMDGANVYHGLGSIFGYITGSTSGSFFKDKIPKRKVTSSEILESCLQIQAYPKGKDMATISDLAVTYEFNTEHILATTVPGAIDYLRVCASLTSHQPPVSGLMKNITRHNTHPGQHTIEYLPLIDLKSTDLSSIFTALEFIEVQHKLLKLPGIPVIGFDQPLYKAAMIVRHHKKTRVDLVLGNFHTQMSFLGAMGKLMENSGLAQALQTVYGDNAVKYILNGKSYERAIRAHALVSSVLKKILLQLVPDDEQHIVDSATMYLEELMKNDDESVFSFDSLEKAPIVEDMTNLVKEIRSSVTVRSPVNELFLQYLDMYDILLMNIHAERLGDWKRYLRSLELMLPYMAAAAHRPYTKTLVMFPHDMENNLDDYTKAAFNRGEWVFRRTNKAFAGVSLDLGIEQHLMSVLKGHQGLTRGRGFNPLNCQIWILSRPIVCAIDMKVREMTKVDVRSFEQSAMKENRASRTSKDIVDMGKIEAYFLERMVFDPNMNSTNLVNIATGLQAPESCNVHKSFNVGVAILESMQQQNPLTVKIPKAILAVRIPSKAVVSTKKQTNCPSDQLDPELILQRALRLIVNKDVSISLEDCLKYEMHKLALPIFDEAGFMRANTKSELAKILLSMSDAAVIKATSLDSLPEGAHVVLDGGALLYRVGWTKGSSFKNIIDGYKAYIRNLVGQRKTSVVFDGYLINSTKDHIHKKRQPIAALTINITPSTNLSCRKEVFLSNTNNKQCFVDMLSESLIEDSCDVTVLSVKMMLMLTSC